MVEHLVCNQDVVGSSPVASTRGRFSLRDVWVTQNDRGLALVVFFENRWIVNVGSHEFK